MGLMTSNPKLSLRKNNLKNKKVIQTLNSRLREMKIWTKFDHEDRVLPRQRQKYVNCSVKNFDSQ